MADIQHDVKENYAQESTELIAGTLGIPVDDNRLVEVQRDLLAVLEEDFVVKPSGYDYDEFSTNEIRDALRFLEADIEGSALDLILPEAMADAVVEVLTQVLTNRENALAKGK